MGRDTGRQGRRPLQRFELASTGVGPCDIFFTV
jgi:hypothetical protein